MLESIFLAFIDILTFNLQVINKLLRKQIIIRISSEKSYVIFKLFIVLDIDYYKSIFYINQVGIASLISLRIRAITE